MTKIEREMAKLKFLGLIKASSITSTALNLKEVSDDLEITVTTLKKWTNEFAETDEAQDILALISMDKLLLSRITKVAAEEIIVETLPPELEEIKQEMESIDDDLLHIDEAGNILVKSPIEEATVSAVMAFKDDVDGLQLLSKECQGTAGALVTRIAKLANDPKIEAKELNALTMSLASIQNAFFNKPQTNVQVNLPGGSSSPLLTSFQENLKS